MTVGYLRACRRGSNQRRALKAFLIQMIARRARSLVVCSDSMAMCSRDLPERQLLGLLPLWEISWHKATVTLRVNRVHSGHGAPVMMIAPDASEPRLVVVCKEITACDSLLARFARDT